MWEESQCTSLLFFGPILEVQLVLFVGLFFFLALKKKSMCSFVKNTLLHLVASYMVTYPKSFLWILFLTFFTDYFTCSFSSRETLNIFWISFVLLGEDLINTVAFSTPETCALNEFNLLWVKMNLTCSSWLLYVNTAEPLQNSTGLPEQVH